MNLDHGGRRHPHIMIIFPSIYGHEITPVDRESPLLHIIIAVYLLSSWFSVGAPPTLLAAHNLDIE